MRPAGGPGAVVPVLRACQPGQAGVGAQDRRGGGSRRPAATAERQRGTQAPLPPDARNARQIGCPGGDRRRLYGGDGIGRSVAGGYAGAIPRGSPRGWPSCIRTAWSEIGLFKRSADALADVLRGGADPLTLLFSSGEPTAADLYLKAPVARAANRMLADAVQALVARLPEGRRLRVLEIGAGTGSATASVLPELAGRPVRLHLHGHLRGLLRRSRGAFRQ